MILLFSWNEYEQGTQAVEDWLLYYDVPFLRISPKDIYAQKEKWFFDVGNRTAIYDGLNLSKEIRSVWIRKYPIPDKILSGDDYIHNALNKELSYEYRAIADFLMFCIGDSYTLGTTKEISFDKMKSLYVAKEVGLNIPETIITNISSDIKKFHKGKRIVTKQVNGCFKNIYSVNGCQYMSLTSEVQPEDYVGMELVFPSLYQEYLVKNKELRITVVEDKIYSTVYINYKEADCDKKAYSD